MDALSLLRTLGALGLVLGILAAGLWAMRRLNLRLPGAAIGEQRVQLVERTALDAKRSVVLIRRDGREHLLVVGPEGTVVVESSITRDEVDLQAAKARRLEVEARDAAAAEAMREARHRLTRSMERAWSRSAVVRRQAKVVGRRLRLAHHASRLAMAVRASMAPSTSFTAVLARHSTWKARPQWALPEKESQM